MSSNLNITDESNDYKPRSNPDYSLVDEFTGVISRNDLDECYGHGANDRLQSTGRMPWLSDKYYEYLD